MPTLSAWPSIQLGLHSQMHTSFRSRAGKKNKQGRLILGLKGINDIMCETRQLNAHCSLLCVKHRKVSQWLSREFGRTAESSFQPIPRVSNKRRTTTQQYRHLLYIPASPGKSRANWESARTYRILGLAPEDVKPLR